MRHFLIGLLLAGSTVFAQGTVKFSGKIANPNTDKLVVVKDNKAMRVIKVAKDGSFSESFEIPTGIYDVMIGQEFTEVFFKAGQDLNLTMDTKEFDESIKYTGKGSKENNFLAAKVLEEEAMGEKAAALQNKPDELMKLVNDYNASIAKRMGDGLDPDLKKSFEAKMQAEMAANAKAQEEYLAMKAKNAEMNGKPSASFNYENHKGGTTKLEDLRGKYVYIDTWATWCGPCIREIPAMKKIEEKYHGKNIHFVGISIDETKDYEKWKKFVTDRQLGGIQLYADKAWESDFCRAYNINSIPRFILIDPNGMVVDADAPRPSDPKLAETLDKLLN